jgi:hypothetical protein
MARFNVYRSEMGVLKRARQLSWLLVTMLELRLTQQTMYAE